MPDSTRTPEPTESRQSDFPHGLPDFGTFRSHGSPSLHPPNSFSKKFFSSPLGGARLSARFVPPVGISSGGSSASSPCTGLSRALIAGAVPRGRARTRRRGLRFGARRRRGGSGAEQVQHGIGEPRRLRRRGAPGARRQSRDRHALMRRLHEAAPDLDRQIAARRLLASANCRRCRARRRRRDGWCSRRTRRRANPGWCRSCRPPASPAARPCARCRSAASPASSCSSSPHIAAR